jgi:hypothetical protein
MQVEMERGEEHWGRKIEVFERSMGASLAGHGQGSDDEDKENVLVENVSQENERLRRENEILRREVAGMSPTKRMPLQERGSDAGSPRPARAARGGGGGGDDEGLRLRLEKLCVNDDQGSVRGSVGSVSPKKMRRLPTKKWNAVADDDLFRVYFMRWVRDGAVNVGFRSEIPRQRTALESGVCRMLGYLLGV